MSNEPSRTVVHPILMGREVENIGIACPLCENEGKKTVGGYTPELRRLAEGDDRRVFCVGTHGYIYEGELSA